MLILVRDPNLVPVAEIDLFSELRWTERLHAVGGWALTTTPGAIGPLLDPGHGITVLDDDGTVVLSGAVGVSSSGLPTFRRTIAEDGTDAIVVSGVDDMACLSDRLVWPEPYTAEPPFAAESHDVRTGIASTVLLEYIAVNAGPGALVERRTPNLTMAPDPLVGSVVTGRARFANLLGLVDQLATMGGVIVGVRQVDRTLVASVAPRQDRSQDVTFSTRFGNVSSADYAAEPLTGTWVIAGGSGEGTARTFVTTPSPVGRRIEVFNDQRSISDTAELQASADVALVEAAGKTSLTFQPIESDGLRFGRDFQIGDVVSVDIDDVRFSDVVASADTTLNPSGLTRTLTVGRESTAGALSLVHGIRTLARRVSALERI